MPSRPRDDAGIVIPLRSFTVGKARLASVLSQTERAALARSMAERVVRAAGTRPIAIVSSAPEVVAWARAAALDVIDDPGSLDGAAAAARGWAEARGLPRYAVVHADLPLAESFDEVVADGPAPVAVIVSDHRDDGTPVISLPTANPFSFAYGPDSAARHRREAARRGLTVRMLDDPALAFDVDIASDLHALEARRRAATP